MAGNYGMGIGRTPLGDPGTRFMRKMRWTVEFYWDDDRTLADDILDFIDRVRDGVDAVNGVIDAVDAAGETISGDRGIFDGVIRVGTGIKDAIEYGKEFISPTKAKRFGVKGHTVHLATRPSITMEETEVKFLHEKKYLAGVPTWEPMRMTFYDIRGDSQIAAWLYQVYRFGKHGASGPMSEERYYKCRGFLVMWDGEGVPIQSWVLHGCWPSNVDWGDLDYSSSDTADVSVTLRFDSADLIYERKRRRGGNLQEYPPGYFDSIRSPGGSDRHDAPDGGKDDSIIDVILAGGGVGGAIGGL